MSAVEAERLWFEATDDAPPHGDEDAPVNVRSDANGDPELAFRLAAMRSRLLDNAGLDALPPPSWLIEGVLQQNSLATLFGPPGAGK